MLSIFNQSRSRLGWIILTLGMLLASQKEIAFAQVNPDASLPSNSKVIQQGNIYNITGGTQAGNNLFHSFEKFSVPDGGEAYFNNAVDIQNIINRVTGKSISEINGLIRANGTANLFLINPNGFLFGENAKLDIGGSFIGSTADSFKFGDDKAFSAINLNERPLLSINVPLGLQYGKNPGNIEIKAKGDTQRNTVEILEQKSGLQVPVNKTLALLGGDVLLKGATLKAGSGRIELASVTGEEFVSIASVEKGFDFDFDNVDNFGEIALSQNTAVDSSGNGAGNVRATGKNLTLADSSVISSTQTGTKKSAGIVVNATDKVEINGINDVFFTSGLYANNMSDGVIEETSNIAINTQQLSVRNGATIATNSYSDGKGGDINIKASNLSVESGAIVSAIVSSSGDGGNIDIDSARVQVIGFGNNHKPSELSVSAKENSTGNTGNLNINTSSLLAENGGFLAADTYGKGNGGNITINATNKIEVIGKAGSDEDKKPSGLFVTAEPPSTGDSGSLIINTKRMVIKNGAFVNVSNNVSGNAGNLKIITDDLLLQNEANFFAGRKNEDKVIGELNIKAKNLLVEGGSVINAGTSGDSGNLNIDAEDIQVIGTGNNGNTPSNLNVSASLKDSGNININTKRLLIKDGAFISAGTSDKGNGGDLNINAEDVWVIGKGGNNSKNNNQPYSSGLFATAELSETKNPSTGNAGNLTINTQRMLVQDGAFVSSAGNSKGNGGDLIINASRLQVKDGSSVNSGTSISGTGGNLQITANNLLVESRSKISSGTAGIDNAGNLTINSDSIQVSDKAQITVESMGTGNAGILTLDAGTINLDNEASLNASTQSADSNNEQATININNTRDLILRRGSNIFTNAKGENVRGGNINIDSDIIAAIPNENSDISANSENFRGGNIKIEAQGIFGTQFREESTFKSDITATGASQDLSGIVEINTPDIDPNNELVELPSVPINNKLTQGCYSRGYAQNQFFIVGRGGLPPIPQDFLTPSAVRVEWISRRKNRQTSLPNTDIEVEITNEKPRRIIEATGWITNDKGEIIFTADAPAASANTILQAYKC